MYMGGAVTMLDIPSGGNRMVKELEIKWLKSFKHPWRERIGWLRIFNYA